MLKITYKQLVDSAEALAVLSGVRNIELSKKMKVSWTVDDIMKFLDNYNEGIKTLRKECIEYKDGEVVTRGGVPGLDKAGNTVMVGEKPVWSDHARFETEYELLMKQEIEIDVKKINSADLEPVKKEDKDGNPILCDLTIGHCSALRWLIE